MTSSYHLSLLLWYCGCPSSVLQEHSLTILDSPGEYTYWKGRIQQLDASQFSEGGAWYQWQMWLPFPGAPLGALELLFSLSPLHKRLYSPPLGYVRPSSLASCLQSLS